MTHIVHFRTVGDTLTPLYAQLKQRDSTGALANVDLTGLVVKIKVLNADGTTHITPKNATIDVAASGQVSYDFLAAEVDTAGDYFIWFQVYNAGETEFDTFPVDGKTFKMILVPSYADT